MKLSRWESRKPVSSVLPRWRYTIPIISDALAIGQSNAAAGFVSVHFVNVVGIPMVAPFLGRDSRFGTNPFCAVFPRKNDFPLLLDYATSAIAFGKTRVAWHKGEPVAPMSD